MVKIFQYLALGLVAGSLSGTIGIGGGIILVPALVLIFEFSQHQAQGTSLAFMLPPVGILATWNYWKAGHVNWKFALILSLTFVVGAYLGSQFSIQISDKMLRRVFGFLLLVVAVKMIFSK